MSEYIVASWECVLLEPIQRSRWRRRRRRRRRCWSYTRHRTSVDTYHWEVAAVDFALDLDNATYLMEYDAQISSKFKREVRNALRRRFDPFSFFFLLFFFGGAILNSFLSMSLEWKRMLASS